MSAATAQKQPLVSTTTSRHHKRRNPASRARDNQTTPSGLPQTQDLPKSQQQQVSKSSKPVLRAEYKPEPDFNVHEIVPSNKPSKSLSRLAEVASSNKLITSKLPLARIDDCPSPAPSDTVSVVEEVQHSISKPPVADPTRVMFVAYGIESYVTQVRYNEICYKFVSRRHSCPYGLRCSRIHPIATAQYAEQAEEELRRYGEEKDKARQALAELTRTNDKTYTDATLCGSSCISNTPAKLDRSSSIVSSASSSSPPSTPSLSLSSITTLSSPTSCADSSTSSSEFYSANSSPIASSSSSLPKANPPSSPESPPRFVESPLDTPTLDTMRISPQTTPLASTRMDIQDSERVRGPKFYSATISGMGPSESYPRKSGVASGNVRLSVPPHNGALPSHTKSSVSPSSSLPLPPSLPDRPSKPPRHMPYTSMNPSPVDSFVSTLQHQAAQKLVSHSRQHFRDNSLSMPHNMTSDNHDSRYRSQSTSISHVHPLPPKPPMPFRQSQNNLSRTPHTTLEAVVLSLNRPNNQQPATMNTLTMNNNDIRETGMRDSNPRGFKHIHTVPHHNYNVNSLPSMDQHRPLDSFPSNVTPVHQSFNYKPTHTIAAGFKHAVQAHLNPDYDKSLQRVQVETINQGIPNAKSRASFGPGFTLVDVVTGMDTCWLYIRGFPPRWSGPQILGVLGEFGEVAGMQNLASGFSGPPLKVQYKQESGALNAMRHLQGRIIEGRKLEISLGLKTGKNAAAVIRDTTVQIGITIPYVNIWVGYETEEASLAAIEKARTTPFMDFLTTAEPFQGLPAVGFKTVKFTAPGFMKPDDMKMFGENEGVVTALSYRTTPYPTMDSVVSGLQKLLERADAEHITAKPLPGPYRNGFIRFNLTCKDGNTAQKLAQQLDRRRIPDIATVYARRVFSMTMSVERPKYQKAAAQIAEVGWSAKKLGFGHSIYPDDRGTASIKIHIMAETLKSVGFFKSQVDKTLNGTVAAGPDGRYLWDDSFEYGQGIALIRDLERRFAPVTIRRDLNRRNIRVFGPEGKAAHVRRIIEQRIIDLGKRAQRSIPLDGALWNYFCEGPFQDLEDQLGSEAIQLEYQTRLLHVRGDESVYLDAARAVKEARRKMRALRHGTDNQSDCPVCFDKVDNPIKLLCGHEYCRDCLRQYLNTAVVMKFFPLTCHGNGGKCNEKIALEIARRILTPSQWNDVIGAAFKAHIQQNPSEFHYCPTPDCNEVYRPAPEGIIYNCPSCFSQICPNCNSEAHLNLTCAEVKEGVGEYRAWAEQHNVKQCPRCKVGIEKAAGCNHMTCTLCRTHICWVCLQTFPDGGSGIYDHMRDKHGGMGLVPDVEEAH